MLVNHGEFITFLGSTIIIFLYSLIFIFFGQCLLRKILKKTPNDYLLSAMSFFLGATSMLSLWCNLETLTNRADVSLVTASLIFIVFIFYNKGFNWRCVFSPLLNLKKISLFFSIFVFTALFFFSRIHPQDFSIDTHLGSGSTMLYFNKLWFYYSTNDIPRSTNSIGQSLLAAIPLYFSFAKSGLLNLFSWTFVCVLFYCLLIYGFLKEINLSKKHCFLGAFFLIFGSVSFSILPVNVIDSGMPIINVMYAHSVLTISTFFSFLIICYAYFKNELNLNLILFALSLLVISSWFITSPENIIIGLPFSIIFFGLLFRAKKITVKSIVILSACFLFASLIGISRGGLLSPAIFRDIEIEKNIPGFQSSPVGQPFSFTHPGVDYSITFVPGVFAFQYPSGQRFHSNTRETEAIIPYVFTGTYMHRIFSKIFSDHAKKDVARILLYESEFWSALRIFFIPIAGIIALFCYARITKNELLYIFSIGSALVFTGGFMLTFFPYQVGLKWPFTRFLLPGIVPGQLCFFISFVLIFEKITMPAGVKKYVFYAIFLLFTMGQVIGFVSSAASNIGAYNPAGENVLKRAQRLISTDHFVL